MLIIVIVLFMLGICPKIEAYEVILYSELSELELLKNRINLSVNDSRFFLIEQQRGAEVDYIAAGLSTPVFTVGPISRFGMFRQIFNPLGYSPGSDVLSERMDLRLNGAFNAGSRRGILLELFPDHLGVFGFVSDSKPLKLGSFLFLPLGNMLCLEGFTILTQAQGELDFEEWFADSEPIPGSMLLHLGWRMYAELTCLNMGLSAVASGGDLIRPGFFSQFHCSYLKSWFAFNLIAGLCTEEYLTPDGKRIDRQYKAGFSLTLNPDSCHKLYCLYEKSIDPPSSFPTLFKGSLDELQVKIEADYRLGYSSFLFIEACGKKELVWSTSGHAFEENKYEFNVSVQSGPVSVGVGCELETAEAVHESTFFFESGLEFGILCLNMKIDKIEQILKQHCSIVLSLDLRTENYNFFIKADSTWTMSLGWEVRRNS